MDQIQVEGGVKQLICGDKTYEARTVIIATGARPLLLGYPVSEMFGGKGVTTVPHVMVRFAAT